MLDALTWLFPVVRGLISLTILLLLGVPVASTLVRLHGPRPGLPAREVMDGWFERLPGLLAWFLLVCSLLRGALQLLSFTDPGEPITADLARAVLLEGSWGTAWVAQSVAAFLLLAISWLWRREPRRLLLVMVLLLFVIVGAQGALGHGADDVWPGLLGRVVHGGHLLGSGLWLGTLAILALVVLPSLRGEEGLAALTSVVRAFSTPARVGAGLVAITGLAAIWRYTGGAVLSLPELLWGRLLLVKVCLVLGAVAVGAWNWRVATPALQRGDAGAAGALRRAIAVELVLTAVILALTAWLVASPLPSHGG